MSETQDRRRAHRRLRMPPMYTSVMACREQPATPQPSELTGHVYDISEAGVRIELDEPLAPGELVHLQLMLPGANGGVTASASVVWVHDSLDDPGPRRMALVFTRIETADQARLRAFLDRELARLAA